ncbi:unnamed protein product [Psylliodes chrysocephalus]|uniref:BED-type domain-containing protein n=1 Tax=Psylliodes chrysocephalus TaxID=3402493 RepID=A0A9P0D6L4_9CUCU|nr:unnamed protein product [Psylliodes chrysocephala]
MRPKSIVWKYFKKVDGKTVTCQICKKDLKYFGGTSNIKQHLIRIHPIQFAAENDTPTEEESYLEVTEVSTPQPQTSNITNKIQETQEFTSLSGPSGVNTSTSEVISRKRPKQLKLYGGESNVEISETKIQQIDNALINMLTKDYQPLSLVENQGFLEYSRALQPLYKPPSRKKITYDLLPKKYAEATSALKNILSNVKYISLTTDIWTSDSTRAYITVTAHFVSEDVLCSGVLATRELPGSHTGENIGTALKNLFSEWDIENKIVAIVSDNGANIKNAITEHLQLHHVPCVAHTLNLIVSDSLKSETLEIIFKKCRNLVGHFKHSSLASDKLKSVQEQMRLPLLKVKQDVPTRWNSCFIMLKRLNEIKEPLCVALASSTKPPQFPTVEEWDIINEIIKVLKSADDMTTIISSQSYPTLSMVIPLVRGFQYTLRNINTVTEVGTALKLKLLETMNRRFGGFETSKIVAKASFMDPRFKKLAFGNEENANSAEKWVSEELKLMFALKKNQTFNIQSSQQPQAEEQEENILPNIWAHFDKKISAVKTYSTPASMGMITIRQYLEMEILDRKKDPFLEFWAKHKLSFAELYDLALKYLSIPATSVPSERVFSKAGQLTNSRRNRLSPKNLDQIIFLNSQF